MQLGDVRPHGDCFVLRDHQRTVGSQGNDVLGLSQLLMTIKS
jgi:hypothetical protein